MRARILAASLAAAFPSAASAVYLNPDGLGQALVYPYYTAQSASGNPFNTYISVVNHAADAKAVRVRFREGRNGAEVASLNLFLSPNDVWTGAVAPSGAGATFITSDRSCVDFGPGQATLNFGNALYAGSAGDGLGAGLDRTREGYIEMFEMGTLGGAAAQAIAHDAAGAPANCAAVQAVGTLAVGPPTGGLSGTLTLINVASGEDFTVNADALADLATQSYFRLPADPYPAFDAAEVTPVSVVNADGQVYRSQWTRGVDAVSAVFMRAGFQAEYVLDPGTRSLTDIVLTSPTRRYYVTVGVVTAPFAGAAGWSQARCSNPAAGANALFGERLVALIANREEAASLFDGDSGMALQPFLPYALCAASTTFSVNNGASHMVAGTSSMVLGSINMSSPLRAVSALQNGWTEIAPLQPGSLASLSTSTRINVSTGATVSGSHRFIGLPMTGMFVRVFQNGTLACSAGACQGNYGGGFPLRYRRSIQSN
jgi:hypothetical protein